MRIAFYSPLKAVDHQVPSGDREMARAFLSLLEDLGHDVTVASRLRSLDKAGNQAVQRRIRETATAEIQRLGEMHNEEDQPELWFTYHAYHKAPDLIGPTVAATLDIPYVIAEASIAGKQACGPWADGHRATIHAVNVASAVLAMTKVDAGELEKFMVDRSRLYLFPPFLTTDRLAFGDRNEARRVLAEKLGLPGDAVWLVTVAMMRPDIKLESYRLLAESLACLPPTNWRLVVVGSGEAASEVHRLLYAAAGSKVSFLGELARADIASVLRACDVFVWPALREAYGIAILEALGAGLPVIACDEGGVGDLIDHEENGLLAEKRSAQALGRHLDRLIRDPAIRQRLGSGAASRVSALHSRRAAGIRLSSILENVSHDRSNAPQSSCN